MIRTQGDVKIFMLPGGIEIIYDSGQPLMDSGLQNYILILLFTELGWPMNKILPISEQIGSDWIVQCRKPINITQIRNLEISATSALKPVSDNNVGIIKDLSVKMKTGNQIYLSFTVDPPGADPIQIELSGYGNNWKLQSEFGDVAPPEKISPSRYLIDDDDETLYDDGLRPLND